MVLMVLWVVLEIAFFILVRFYVHPKLEAIKTPHHHFSDPLATIKRVFDTIDSLEHMSLERYLFKFFKESKFEEIQIENFRSFIAWAMFGQHLKDLSQAESLQVAAAIEEAYSRYEILHKMKPGKNHKVKHTAFNLEPLQYIHRPLLMYVGAGVLEVTSDYFSLRMNGFISHEIGGFKYWYRHKTVSNKNTKNYKNYKNMKTSSLSSDSGSFGSCCYVVFVTF
jgi:hypothetical protein